MCFAHAATPTNPLFHATWTHDTMDTHDHHSQGLTLSVHFYKMSGSRFEVLLAASLGILQ